MRILVIGPAFHGGWVPGVASACTRLGHQVQTHTYRHGWTWQAVMWGRLVSSWRRFRPDLLLVLKGEVFAPTRLAEIAHQLRARWVTWWVDDPYGASPWWWRHPHYQELWTLAHRAFAFRPMPGWAYLPCAVDYTVYTRIPRAPRQPVTTFIDSYSRHRAQVLAPFQSDQQFQLYGPGWHTDWGPWALQWRGYRGASLPSPQCADLYAASMINLNVHQPQSAAGGVNSRTFEIPCAGGFQLCDQIPGVEDILTPCEEIVLYDSASALREHRDRYLREPKARARIVSAAQRRVLAHHTYGHRMRTLLRAVA